MQSVSQKIRTGVLELRTPSGSLYVSLSFWERLYLLWIFRNFRSLSRQVLSLRQQRLIDRLCRSAGIIEGGVPRVNIIGAIENARAILGRSPALPLATNNLLEIPTRKQSMPLASAVGAPVLTIPNKQAEDAKVAKSLRFHAPRVTEIFARQRKLSDSRQDTRRPKLSNEQQRQQHRQWLEWAMGAALAGALLGVLLYVRELRPLSLASLSRHGIAAQPGSVPREAPMASTAAPMPSSATTPVAPAASTNSNHPDSVRSALGTRRQPILEPESSSTPRIQLSGPPEHSFIYPEAPNSVLTGTVDLRAVIGSDGSVKRVDIMSGKPALAHAAIQAVRNWRYAVPATGGQAVEAETRVVISFIGDDAVSISFPQSRN